MEYREAQELLKQQVKILPITSPFALRLDPTDI